MTAELKLPARVEVDRLTEVGESEGRGREEMNEGHCARRFRPPRT